MAEQGIRLDSQSENWLMGHATVIHHIGNKLVPFDAYQRIAECVTLIRCSVVL